MWGTDPYATKHTPIIHIPIIDLPMSISIYSLWCKHTFSLHLTMWSNLHFDLLANIFSFLSPDSLARASSACWNWHTCAKTYALSSNKKLHRAAWFLALPTRQRGLTCYAYNPIVGNWHVLALDFVNGTIRPIAPIGGLILFRPTTAPVLHLTVCNPFTRRYRSLPELNIARTNPAVGVIELGPTKHSPCPYFRVYVAGGMSDEPTGGASYEPTLEMYDSRHDMWQIIGPMPVEFAVRLTVWTPNESVCCNGILYWMTSARAYSVMGFEIGTGMWRELSVPMADRLEFAALVPRNGELILVGGTCGGDACIWELGEDDIWRMIEKVPEELSIKFIGGKGSWGCTKCVGVEGAMCLYRDLGSGMVVWKKVEDKGKWEWFWVEGCGSIKGRQVPNFPIKGVLIHPNLAPSYTWNI